MTHRPLPRLPRPSMPESLRYRRMAREQAAAAALEAARRRMRLQEALAAARRELREMDDE